MSIIPEEIQLSPEQQKQIAVLAEQQNKSWEEVLQEMIRDRLNSASPSPEKPRRKAGSAKGKIWMAPDFDAPMEEFKDYM